MRKLGKKNHEMIETVVAHRSCNCSIYDVYHCTCGINGPFADLLSQ